MSEVIGLEFDNFIPIISDGNILLITGYMAGFAVSFFKWSFLIGIFLLLLGILFEQYSRWQLEKSAFTDKTFVNIHGKPLHYVKKGQGNCTVVFQSGMGSGHGIWREIQDSLASDAVTLSYDRNGLGLSEANSTPATNDAISEELQLLLEKTNCPKPYILVGHSMAGIYLRPFIKQHEKDIVGIVFADASHPLQIKKASPELLQALRVPSPWLIKFAMNTGVYRVLYSFVPMSAEIPMDHPLHQQERDFFYRSYHKTIEELAHDEQNFEDAEQYTSFGDIPLTVIMGTAEVRYAGIKHETVKAEYHQLWNKAQHDLLNLSSHSRLVEAPNSGHMLQVQDSQLLVEEIRKLLP